MVQSSSTRQSRAFAAEGEAVAQQGQAIQRKIDQAESGQPQTAKPRPMQAGSRPYPTSFGEQHLAKPGNEAVLDPPPMYEAPDYKGSAKLEDKVALITGGDSGIGRTVAVLYAREGADVAIVYLNEHDDAKTAQQAVEQEGRRCIVIAGDIANPAFCREAVAQTLEAFGQLDILVNNAAFQEHVPHFMDLSAEQFDRTLKTNLYGYFHMAQAAVPHCLSAARSS